VATRTDQLTIDELARRTGMTVRNLRAHQSRGLLPPPEVRGRTGFYGPEHISRIELIRELQADGFNLNSIKFLLAGAHSAGGRELLSFTRAVRAPWEAEESEFTDRAELGERLGSGLDEKALKKVVDLGLVVPLGQDRYEVPSPVLLNAAEQVVALGMPLDAALGVIRQLNRSAEDVARSFIRLFLEGVWKPFADAGHPESEWPRVGEAIESLRPLASEALLAGFQVTMTREVEAAFGGQLRRASKRSR
jgi:DNA-binding transcriptional MerR regulator